MNTIGTLTAPRGERFRDPPAIAGSRIPEPPGRRNFSRLFPPVTAGTAMHRLNATTAVIAATRLVPELVDNPAVLGRIAAAHALSAVFALGGEVAMAQHVGTIPDTMTDDDRAALFDAASEMVAAAGGTMAGNAVVPASDLRYGLATTGLVHPGRSLSADAVQPGDALYLTKPLGALAILEARVMGAPRLGAIASMEQLNRRISQIAVVHRLQGAADVSGGSLLARAARMAEGAGVGVVIEAGSVPVLPGALDAARPTRTARVSDLTISDVTDVEPRLLALLNHPEISGGLLIACAARRMRTFETRLEEAGEQAWYVGRIEEAGRSSLTIA